jgi:Amidohydrolase
MEEVNQPKGSRIINCHTHIFTGDYVPPWLGKSIVGPAYILFPLTLFVKIFRWWYSSRFSPFKWRLQPWYKRVVRIQYRFRMAFIRYFIFRLIKIVAALIFLASVFHDLYQPTLRDILAGFNIANSTDKLNEWLGKSGFIIITDSIWIKILLLVLLLLFFPSGKSLILFLFRRLSIFFNMLPGRQTKSMFQRYINLVRYARYLHQGDIFTRLVNQYPTGSAMVVLPMDMEFMKAGKPMKPYGEQMYELSELKRTRPEQIFPFVFVDPRRQKVGQQHFFNYEIVNGKVKLGDCFINDYIEKKGFNGFKIYPALGYFPFDEKLLPLWKYAADNGIPIMTHCIRGPIYYRGAKKKSWDQHPIFKQAMGKGRTDYGTTDPGDGSYQPMLLPQMKMVNLQEAFTHPLNYLCLLDPFLLARVIGQSKSEKLKMLFGYDEDKQTISHNLEELKICFGHFGGEDEWLRFFEKDRDNFSSQLLKHPARGIDFMHDENGKFKPGKLELIWKGADWYSIICSLMLQYDNIYADISYILHSDTGILPLLKQTMKNEKLSTRVLYGSDFYVVRNHKSDKNMLINITGGLDSEEFSQIASVNPVRYLERKEVFGLGVQD